MRVGWSVVLLGVVACAPASDAPKPTPDPLKSGFAFLTADTQALQSDSFENPALLWVDRGEALFNSNDGSPSCASCHDGDDLPLKTAAARHPQIDETTGALVNLEGRINLCRIRYQEKPALDFESVELLSLTSFVTQKAKGVPRQLAMSPKLQSAYDRGETYFFTRRGQLNLSCAQCHNAHWGQKLRGDTISQGHSNGFPTYRFAWENVGSLHRRLSDCDIGVRAEPNALGSQTYLDLEVYLAVRSGTLPIEAPAVRR